MSHTMMMTVVNNASKDISSYDVSHSWDGNTNSCTGQNLTRGARSDSAKITSGHLEYDHYHVTVTFTDGTPFHTKFYCNSSTDQDAVEIQIGNSSCNCVYFSDGGVDTGCYSKG
jgi:hypothetical protein